ncbi:MAG: EamA family transporter RarD [Candidatus Marinimicrobia bacterium]|nr:EamA family transporter RarD [Candidatus Neomarinimicrobiota bacterium]
MKHHPFKGYFYTFLSYLCWGILPIYWKLLKQVSPLEILVHRIFWTLIILLFINAVRYRVYLSDTFRHNKNLKYILLSALMIGTNWFLFIYAISINRILDASLGYYINPLVSVLLGVLVLREKLPREQKISVFLAFLGVLYLALNYGRLPLLSLALAVTFALYSLIRKKINLKAIPALMLEAALVLPLFLVIFFNSVQSFTEIAFLNSDFRTVSLLIFSGIVTLVPLLLFGQGVTMIPLKSVGFLQYISPTFMLLIGTLIYNEPFTTTHLISFSFIWLALGLYTYSVIKR